MAQKLAQELDCANTMNPFRDNLFYGKTVVVAGASGGINLELAKMFSRHGGRVAVISRDRSRIEAAATAIRVETGNPALGLAGDVRDYQRLERVMESVFAEFGAFDVVISGAAGNFVARAADMSANGFKSVVDIDLIGTFNVLRAAYAYFVKPGASVINISAPQATSPYDGQAHVSSAKAGINLLTQSLALEWGKDGIRVNAISPGPVSGTEGMARLTPDRVAVERLSAAIPMGRFGAKDEIANLAMFLCSEAAAYITGTIIPCDGGLALMGAGGWR